MQRITGQSTFYLRHRFNKIGSTYFRIARQAYENSCAVTLKLVVAN